MPHLRSCVRLRLVSVSLFLLPLLSGCSLSHFDDVSSSPVALPAMSGSVHGGQQPVAGASIQLYAANSTTNQGASLALIPAVTPVTTDAGGRFSITGKYICPTPTTSVYIAATGGNPGLSAGTSNTGIALLTALGPCGAFLTGGDNVFININELTTVAALESLAPFTADLTHIGADSLSNPKAISLAMQASNSIVPYSSGQFAVGVPSAVVQLYNTLANIIASCVNTAGNSGASTNCAKLYSATGSAADTVAALLYLVQHPASNIAALFALASSNPPFQPNLPAAPADYTVGLVIKVPNTGEYRCCTDQRLAIDTSQQVWVGNMGTQGVHVYSNSGTLLYTLTLPNPLGVMASDPLGNVWFVTRQVQFPYVSITKYNSSGTLLSPPAGYQLDQGTSNQIYTYLAGSNALRFDSLGNFWIAGSQGGTGKSCAMKFSSTATYLLSACPTTFNSYLPAVAVDSSDNVYLAVGTSLYKFSSLGVAQFATPPPIYSTGGNFYLHYDPTTDHIWLFDGNNVAIYASNGTVVKAKFADSLHFNNPFGLDGAGNAIASSGYPIGITQFDPTGTIILPPGVNPNDLYLGYQSYNALTTVVGNFEVDALGNVWGVGGNNVLARVSGLATPRVQVYR